MDKDMMESIDKNNYFNRADMIQPDYDIYEHFEEEAEQISHKRR